MAQWERCARKQARWKPCARIPPCAGEALPTFARLRRSLCLQSLAVTVRENVEERMETSVLALGRAGAACGAAELDALYLLAGHAALHLPQVWPQAGGRARARAVCGCARVSWEAHFAQHSSCAAEMSPPPPRARVSSLDPPAPIAFFLCYLYFNFI